MKKRLFVFMMSIVSLMLVYSMNEVLAYSADCLPGGKNYLTEDNFSTDGIHYAVIEPFLVKPYTEYTLTVPKQYLDEPYAWITLVFLDNGSFVDDFGIYMGNMVYYNDGLEEWYTYTFTTSSDTNYLDLMFDDTGGYFTEYGFYGFQMEEGNGFTGYEAYIEGVLYDVSAPYFQDYGTVISYYDAPITIEEIQSALVAYDDIDGDVTGNISLISDGYTPNLAVIGSYEVVFEVSDASMNTSQIVVEIELIDALKPVFSDIGTVTAVFPNVYTPSDILAMLFASDNYDGDISANIELVSDSYTSFADIVGTYQMEFSVTDSSGNTTNYIQDIEVVDDEGPVISGITSVVVGYNTTITDSEIMLNLACMDNYDNSESLGLVLVTDNYTNYHNQLGSYSMVFSVTDSSGNITFQTVQIQVVDEIGPVVYFDSSIIQTYNDTVLALPDFMLLLTNANEVDGSIDYQVSMLYDSYTRNAATPGVYHVTLKYQTTDGESFEKTLEIRVVEKDPDYIYIPATNPEENSTALSQIKQYFVTGAVTLLLLVSNIVWVVVFKKK